MCINILSALLTPLIAIIALYIAYQQYFINRRKLNLDLYLKRFQVFDETKRFLLRCSKNDIKDYSEVQSFHFSVNESKFLFGDEIIEFLNTIQNKAIDLDSLSKEVESLSISSVGSPEQARKSEEKKKLLTWFSKEYENIESRFIKYMDFKKV